MRNHSTDIPRIINITYFFVILIFFSHIFLDCLTNTLSPVKPFPNPPESDATFEVTEFMGTSDRDYYPYTTFVNHLFIYPIQLTFDSQKLFSRARNIAVFIELRDSDAEGAKPLKVRFNWIIEVKTIIIFDSYFFSVFTVVPVLIYL